MGIYEKYLYVITTEYQIGILKKLQMHVYLYESCIQCAGVSIKGDTISDSISTYEIPYTDLISAELTNYRNEPCLKLQFKIASVFTAKVNTELYILGAESFEECRDKILLFKEQYLAKKAQQEELKKSQLAKRENAKKQYEIEAEDFYKNCYNFHVKENTPVFTLYEEKNQIVLIYIDNSKGLNFLKINGYDKSEDVGLIPYDKIHYYEKAGDIHYVAETNGSYSSFGGSLTGATFSKRAALLHGFLFGPMGMATAALMSYKPAEQKPTETHFDIRSETVRIDERSVILNFYSDEKQQYVDIELPQNIYNFLQTHIPQKRYMIVSELEKHAAVQNAALDQKTIEAPSEKLQLPEAKKLTMEEFKEKVEKLKLMNEAGILTEEEFAQAKAELLSNI